MPDPFHKSMRTIAIIGGGPAGATAAEKLAQGFDLRSGGGRHRVIVFEEKIGWEKPCGGGLTHKALQRYPFLAQATEGAKLLHEAEFLAASGATIRFRLRTPLAVYSRAALNRLLLQRAAQAGAEIFEDRILRFRRDAHGWEIEGRAGAYRADFIVLAAGARTQLRSTLAEHFHSQDFMLTFGYYLPVPCTRLRVQFYEDFEGYAWAFPRPDHVSVGICGKGESMASLKSRLRTFMQTSGYAADESRIFSHLLPALSLANWANLRLGGRDWTLAGDAAGLVDPVTGEGIYYAMRSGELLAAALREGAPQAYADNVRQDFGNALATGARLVRLFYHGQILGGGLTTRMIEFGAHSRRIRDLLQDLVEDSQSYAGLVPRLEAGMARIMLETAAGKLRRAAQTAFAISS